MKHKETYVAVDTN